VGRVNGRHNTPRGEPTGGNVPMTRPAPRADDLDEDPGLGADLATEAAHLDASRAELRRMREHAQALFATGDGVAGDAWAAETLGRTLARRVAELADDPNTPLFFGGLDFGPGTGEHAGHRYHIGRRHVTDEAGEP